MKAYISLGSNIGDRQKHLQDAVDALRLVPGISVTAASKIYETLPVGYTEQGNFFNAVVEVETEIGPEALLGVCLGIEAGLGRHRIIKDGPR
nr:2-amino-4-hydroxy-6-hydroxymethyldihydropteridine diphosphokinase [Clostridiales bacterium]